VAAQRRQPAHQGVIVGGDRPALAGGDVLYRVEAENGHVRQGSHRPAVVGGSQGMGGVFHHYKVMLAGNVHYVVHVRRVSGEVHRDQRPGAGGDAPLDFRRVYVHRVPAHVGKDGPGSQK